MTATPYIFKYNGEIITGYYQMGNRIQCSAFVVQYWVEKSRHIGPCKIKHHQVEILQVGHRADIVQVRQIKKTKGNVKKRIGNLELTYSMNTGRLVHTRSVK